jgi:hypothetical protein
VQIVINCLTSGALSLINGVVAFKLLDATPGRPTTIRTSGSGAAWIACVGMRDVWVVVLNVSFIPGFELTGFKVSAMKATLILCLSPKNCRISRVLNASKLSYARKKSRP